MFISHNLRQSVSVAKGGRKAPPEFDSDFQSLGSSLKGDVPFFCKRT